MTGIERLRELSKGMHNHRVTVWQLTDDAYEERFGVTKHGPTIKNFLSDIADQIERETKTSSEVEKMKCGPDDVSMSAYDLLPADEREAIAWVREHGGLDEVRRRWKRLSCYADFVPRSCMERRLARLQRQIDESHAALRRRNQRIAVLASEINRAHNENRMEFMRRAGNYTAFADEVCKRLAPHLRYVEGCTKDVMDAALEALDRRLMPEGCEWPRYESGDLVMFGDCVENRNGTCTVNSVRFYSGGGVTVYGEGRGAQFVVVTEPVMHDPIRKARPKVLAADGEPLEVGQTVWDVYGYGPLVVKAVPSKGEQLVVLDDGGTNFYRYPEKLTHERPDSWERIEEDARGLDSGFDRELFTHTHEDIVRRCRALAEREGGE